MRRRVVLKVFGCLPKGRALQVSARHEALRQDETLAQGARGLAGALRRVRVKG